MTRFKTTAIGMLAAAALTLALAVPVLAGPQRAARGRMQRAGQRVRAWRDSSGG